MYLKEKEISISNWDKSTLTNFFLGDKGTEWQIKLIFVFAIQTVTICKSNNQVSIFFCLAT